MYIHLVLQSKTGGIPSVEGNTEGIWEKTRVTWILRVFTDHACKYIYMYNYVYIYMCVLPRTKVFIESHLCANKGSSSKSSGKFETSKVPGPWGVYWQSPASSAGKGWRTMAAIPNVNKGFHRDYCRPCSGERLSLTSYKNRIARI